MVRTGTHVRIQAKRASDEIQIGLDAPQREALHKLLNALIADEYVLYAKTKHYKWNVAGRRYKEFESLLQEQTRDLDAFLDEAAGRIHDLGGQADGTLEHALGHARILGRPVDMDDSFKVLRDLLSCHEAVVRHLRSDADRCGAEFGDDGTKAFLINLLTRHEKMASTLRSSLASP